MSDMTDKEYEQALAEEIALEEAKIEEIEKKFESQSIFDRIKLLLRGLKAPAGSREYKEALIEMQRLLAPVGAVVIPLIFIAILFVCSVPNKSNRDLTDINVAKAEEDAFESFNTQVRLSIDKTAVCPELDADLFVGAFYFIHTGIDAHPADPFFSGSRCISVNIYSTLFIREVLDLVVFQADVIQRLLLIVKYLALQYFTVIFICAAHAVFVQFYPVCSCALDLHRFLHERFKISPQRAAHFALTYSRHLYVDVDKVDFNSVDEHCTVLHLGFCRPVYAERSSQYACCISHSPAYKHHRRCNYSCPEPSAAPPGPVCRSAVYTGDGLGYERVIRVA